MEEKTFPAKNVTKESREKEVGENQDSNNMEDEILGKLIKENPNGKNQDSPLLINENNSPFMDIDQINEELMVGPQLPKEGVVISHYEEYQSNKQGSNNGVGLVPSKEVFDGTLNLEQDQSKVLMGKSNGKQIKGMKSRSWKRLARMKETEEFPKSDAQSINDVARKKHRIEFEEEGTGKKRVVVLEIQKIAISVEAAE